MTQELDLQAELVEIFKANGGWGMKMAHAYNKGIPDLMLLPNPYTGIIGPVFLEAKTMEFDQRLKAVPITAPQLSTLSIYSSLYVQCGICIFSKINNEWSLCVHTVKNSLHDGNSVRVVPQFFREKSIRLHFLRKYYRDSMNWLRERLSADPFRSDECGLTYYKKKVSEKRKEKEIWKIR